jgi:hypothetical protein
VEWQTGRERERERASERERERARESERERERERERGERTRTLPCASCLEDAMRVLCVCGGGGVRRAARVGLPIRAALAACSRQPV